MCQFLRVATSTASLRTDARVTRVYSIDDPALDNFVYSALCAHRYQAKNLVAE